MAKFRLLHDLLLADGVTTVDRVFTPELPPTEWLELVHDPAYIQAYNTGTLDPKAQRRIGLPWSPELVNRTLIALSGSILTAKLADVPLREGMEDEEYLKTLSAYLPDLLDRVRPDLVLYDAGVDPHISDLLGKLALSDAGIFQRDFQVLNTCVSTGYPVACVIGGGYAENMQSLVYRHSLLHRAASQVYRNSRL
jgi:acetoin utilization deacetylase AcuC-like enzyme